MKYNYQLRVSPETAAKEELLRKEVSRHTNIPAAEISHIEVLKRSIDARQKEVRINLQVVVFVKESYKKEEFELPEYSDVSQKKEVIIIGAGPAGLFAALRCIEGGVKPVIIERGKDVRSRRRDLKALNIEHIVNEDSNYCFGEGGAGTYSDGKLYTRSKKRGDVNRILKLLVAFGATKEILVDAHPHIGTNKLPAIIAKVRDKILEYGGEVLFETRVTDILIKDNKVTGVKTQKGETITARNVILATGHSARDIFELLHEKGIEIETKPFALGVRVEHPQQLIDRIQYKCDDRGEFLPPSPYSIVKQIDGRGMYSFCMCPGGIIAPAATAPGEGVVNGWSPSKRNNPYANSGMVVSIEEADMQAFAKWGALAAMHFQQSVEQKAFTAGGGGLVAPAQRLVDFTKNLTSASLPDCSYLPGIQSADLRYVLPSFVHQSLQTAFKEFGKKLKGYYTNEAVLVATESRTSSPVRIPRDAQTLQHPQMKGLYPCAEGAGYAGGIVSAAMDGENVAQKIAESLGVLFS